MFDRLSSGVQKPSPDSLPDGWQVFRLGDLCEVTGGGGLGLTKKDDYQSSGIPAYSAAGQDGYVDVAEFDAEAVVLSSIGARCGRCFYASGKWATLANTQVILPKDGRLDARYLYFRVNRRSFWPISGSAQPFIKPSAIRDCWIEVPPASEQKRIVNVLDTVDAAIQETDSVVEKQEQVKTGLLQDLLTRGLDADGRLRDPEREPEAFRETELGTLPLDWEVVDLEAITKRITDGSHQAVDTLPEGSDGIPFLYVSCIRNGEIYWDQASRITRETFESISKGKEPKPGVILYTTVGSYGHAALVEEEAYFSFQRHVGYIDPDTDEISPQFLAYWLDSEYCKRHADKIALGSSQKTVTLRDLARYPVPLPSYEEQKMIAERLDESDSSIQGNKSYKNNLQSLKTGLMQDLLTGRVRVPEAEARVDEIVA
jgi:type I restriction enzyme S subunit